MQTASETAAKPKRRKIKNPSPMLRMDQRTKIARRVRALEAQYRLMVERQGGVVDVHTDILIGNLANAMTRVEIARAAASRSMPVDDNQLTRWLNLAQRLANQLGLRASVTDAPAPSKPIPSLGKLIQAQRAQR